MNAIRRPHQPLQVEETTPFPVEELFPLTIFLACLGSLAGLFYGLMSVFSGDFSGSGGWVEGLLVSLAATVVAHPVLTVLAMLASVVPGLVYFHDKRRYFLTLLLVTLVVWGTSFVYARSPADAIGRAIDNALSSERELPDLQGTKKVGE